MTGFRESFNALYFNVVGTNHEDYYNNIKETFIKSLNKEEKEYFEKRIYSYDDIKKMKFMDKDTPPIRGYIMLNFSNEEIINGLLNKDFHLHLNQLFKVRQFSKEELKRLLNAKEFSKNTVIWGSKIATKTNALRAMLSTQDNADGEIVEYFYHKFCENDPSFSNEAFSFIKQHKKLKDKLTKNMSDECKLLLELT